MDFASDKARLRVKEWRERRGFTIAELSVEAGVNRQNLYKIEAHKTGGVDFKVLARLAKVLRVKPSELIEP